MVIGVVVSDILVGSISRRVKTKLLVVPLLLAAACVFTYISWSVHNNNLGYGNSPVAEISLGEISRAFDPATATEIQQTTIDNFTRRVLLPHPESNISRNYYWLFVCIAFVWLIFTMSKAHRGWKFFVPYTVLFAGFCAYLVVLLVLYMFYFGAYEGPRLASFERYVNPYLIGVLVLFYGISLSLYFQQRWDREGELCFYCYLYFGYVTKLKSAVTGWLSCD